MRIVAPAGNMERFHAAIRAGAQEIYMGLKGFGARRSAQNFTLEEFKEALDYAHLRGSRIFLTLNTVMRNVEIHALYHNLKVLYEHGLDAVIIQDLGYLNFIRNNFKGMEIHGSTQLTIANHVEINYLKKIGFSRVVLPRELSFEEIKSIRENTDMELEVFVSGALCICYSGNCYMSSFLGGRSGNRGMCAQPCRKIYKKEEKEAYYISPKDQLLGIEEIKKLKDIGIESIKIEGRMKDEKYVYQTVNYYKNAINGIKIEEKTSKIFNRGYSKGYFYGAEEEILNRDYSFNMGEILGLVEAKNNVKLLSDVRLGDGITFVSKKYEKLGGNYVNRIQIKGDNSKAEMAEKDQVIILKDIPKGTAYIFKSFSKSVNDETEKEMKAIEKKLEINVEFKVKLGEKAKLRLFFEKFDKEILEVFIASDENIEEAKKNPINEDTIKEKLSELGDTSFIIKNFKCDIDSNLFIPLSALKNLKRKAVSELEEKILSSYRREAGSEYRLNIQKDEEKESEVSFVVSNPKQEEFLRKIWSGKIYRKAYDIAKESKLDFQDLNSKLASNLYQLLENKNDDVILNWNMNVANSYAFEELSKIEQLKTIIISPEISFDEIEKLGKTKLRKAMIIYSRLKAMYIDMEIFDTKLESLKNKEGDDFTFVKNELGNTEVYLEKPLNIINKIDKFKHLCIDEYIIEINLETEEEIENIVKQLKTKDGDYRCYNYYKGVY